ncbi:hypothetical protein CTAYLR_007114 [Chrysophaeum taylorii]|uniref:alpha-1,6-mannosyl-glycoprotein 6-beta-N-acetylglucosaminyltransferase n=1 Tax=Chrysophaeum taylorii TaxID=2483200 RepID=A0AAD7XIE4_9STRA|nr:hypothetical protein CTAYLR_007114 [Chrysophaeum taylorii]
MDSMTGYEANAKRGGASGEIAVRRSLTAGLAERGRDVDVATSDREFDELCPPRGRTCDKYDALVLDAWTWAAPGWKAKLNLVGREGRVFLLDFFGAEAPRRNGIAVPPDRILTAYPTFPGNTFLGFFYDAPPATTTVINKKKLLGVVWGKDPKYYAGKEKVLRAVARVAPLHSTLKTPPIGLVGVPNITFHGHLTKEKWSALLSEAKFVLGLGDPLLGPSALDAVAHGSTYVDPDYPKLVKQRYGSQHPYLRQVLGGEPYVCAAKLDDPDSYVRCATRALQGPPLKSLILPDFTKPAYMARLDKIFFRDQLGPSTSGIR